MDLSELLLGNLSVKEYLNATPSSCPITPVSYPLTANTVPEKSCLLAVFPQIDTHALPFSCYVGGVVDHQHTSQINFYNSTRDFLLSNQDTLQKATRMFVMTVSPTSHECAAHMIRDNLVVSNTNISFCMLDSTINIQKVTTIRG